MSFKLRRKTAAAVGLVLAACVMSGPAPAEGTDNQPLRVMSLNIRCIALEDGADMWFFRSEEVGDYILRHDPDLMGLQEVKALQHQDLQRMLSGYESFGRPRMDGRLLGERCKVFYKSSRLKLLQHGTFWLSTTPDKAGSKSWDSLFPRIVTWGKLRDLKTGKEFYIFNTHFDHAGRKARLESAKLLSRKVEEIAGESPVVITGDFNATPDSKPYQVMTSSFRDGRKVSKSPPQGPSATSWSFQPRPKREKRIDYIFVSEGMEVLSYAVLAETYGKDRRPSDHKAVLARLRVR
ncbi:MAG: endonuclease/exonuclease/phosphatase family protein [bacterium]